MVVKFGEFRGQFNVVVTEEVSILPFDGDWMLGFGSSHEA